MTQIALAWLLTKVESPIVGATKLHHIEGAMKPLDPETMKLIFNKQR